MARRNQGDGSSGRRTATGRRRRPPAPDLGNYPRISIREARCVSPVDLEGVNAAVAPGACRAGCHLGSSRAAVAYRFTHTFFDRYLVTRLVSEMFAWITPQYCAAPV